MCVSICVPVCVPMCVCVCVCLCVSCKSYYMLALRVHTDGRRAQIAARTQAKKAAATLGATLVGMPQGRRGRLKEAGAPGSGQTQVTLVVGGACRGLGVVWRGSRRWARGGLGGMTMSLGSGGMRLSVALSLVCVCVCVCVCSVCCEHARPRQQCWHTFRKTFRDSF